MSRKGECRRDDNKLPSLCRPLDRLIADTKVRGSAAGHPSNTRMNSQCAQGHASSSVRDVREHSGIIYELRTRISPEKRSRLSLIGLGGPVPRVLAGPASVVLSGFRIAIRTLNQCAFRRGPEPRNGRAEGIERVNTHRAVLRWRTTNGRSCVGSTATKLVRRRRTKPEPTPTRNEFGLCSRLL